MIRITPKYDILSFSKEIMKQEEIGLLEDETYYFDFDADCIYMFPYQPFGYKIIKNSKGVYQMKSHILVNKITKWFGQKESFLLTVEKNSKENSEHEREWVLKLKN